MNSEFRCLRVLLIAPSLRITGGQSVQAAKLVSILAELPQISISFFPIDPALPKWALWVRKLPFFRTAVMLILYTSGLLFRVPKCDLLHVFTAGLSSYTLWTIPALLIGRLFGKGFVMHYHDGQAEQHLTEWRSAKPTIALADRVVVPSGFLVDVFARHGIKTEVISNVVELDRFTFRSRQVLRPVFMTNRMLEPLYNVPCILRAFAIIQEQYPDASLTIAHDGYLRQTLEEQVKELKLRAVDFIGRVRYDDIPRIYDQADIYITTPNIDNLPGSILECFASGLPVIATRASGIPYVAHDHQTALLVKLDDHEGVAACAIELLSNPELAAGLTRRAVIEVQKYHWRPIRDQWNLLYRELAESKRLSL